VFTLTIHSSELLITFRQSIQIFHFLFHFLISLPHLPYFYFEFLFSRLLITNNFISLINYQLNSISFHTPSSKLLSDINQSVQSLLQKISLKNKNQLQLAPELVPELPPNPGVNASLERVFEHSGGSVVNAEQIASPIAAGVLPT